VFYTRQRKKERGREDARRDKNKEGSLKEFKGN